MKKTHKFLNLIKTDFNWNISGSGNFEKEMVEIAKSCGILEANISILERYESKNKNNKDTYFKDELKKAVEIFNDPNRVVSLGKEIQKFLKKKHNITTPIIIMHPHHKNQFPDMIIIENEKFEYIDCKIYNKSSKNKKTQGKVYIGEKLEKPNAIYVMFDQGNQRVSWRRGLQMNINLEEANHIMVNLKMNMPKISEEKNDILSGKNGKFGFRIVRPQKKYVPWKDNDDETQEAKVLETLYRDVTDYLPEMTREYWGPFERWMGLEDEDDE